MLGGPPSHILCWMGRTRWEYHTRSVLGNRQSSWDPAAWLSLSAGGRGQSWWQKPSFWVQVQHVVMWYGVTHSLGARSISWQSKYRLRHELSVSWGDWLYLQGFGKREAVAAIWEEGNAPKNGVILGCDMAPRVVEQARSISRWPGHRRRQEFPLMYAACFDL